MWYDILVNSLLCAAAVFPLRKKPEKEQIIMSSIILASQSPRRQELIARITEDFEVIVAEEPTELPSDVQPEEAPVFLASYKAGSVAVNHRDRIVIGADTVVLVDDKVLGKPKDQADAERMLRLSADESFGSRGYILCHTGSCGRAPDILGYPARWDSRPGTAPRSS